MLSSDTRAISRDERHSQWVGHISLFRPHTLSNYRDSYATGSQPRIQDAQRRYAIKGDEHSATGARVSAGVYSGLFLYLLCGIPLFRNNFRIINLLEPLAVAKQFFGRI